MLSGVSQIAMLPPWEGFDETAHYSYLQQITDRKILPRQRKSFNSRDVEKYDAFAPMPYTGTLPAEKNGGFTYKSFFEATPEIRKQGYSHIHRKPDSPRFYSEGKGLNWQSQHPPLYYLLLSPVYSLTRTFSWGKQLFLLRLISYLFAWSGLVVGVTGINRYFDDPGKKEWAIMGVAFWPVIIPSWYPSMARMGNDSLCALIMASICSFLLRGTAGNISTGYFLVLGSMLGLGCLTKALFLPVCAGIFCYWCYRFWKIDPISRCDSARNLAALIVPIGLIAGWWYFANWWEYGVLTGSDEMITLHDAGGLLPNLKEHFHVKEWIRGHMAFITTMGWCGSWSWARPPYIYLFPMVIMLGLIFFSYGSSLRHLDGKSQFRLPVWCVLPVLISFSYHVLVRIAISSEGRGTSGYYLNFMAVPLGLGLGISLYNIWSNKVARSAVILLFGYAIILSTVTAWAQMMLFSGIAYIQGGSKFYQFPSHLPPFLGLSEAMTRLKEIAFPATGSALFAAGSLLIASALGLMWGNARRRKRYPVFLENKS